MHREGLLFSHVHAMDPFYGLDPYPAGCAGIHGIGPSGARWPKPGAGE
jgi:hypothetical protein